jgi:hypothetical protein
VINRELITSKFIQILKLQNKILISRYFVEEIIETINNNFPEFNILKSSQQLLYKDNKLKECAKCHQLKSHSEFRIQKGYLYYLCKVCENDNRAIKEYKKKLKVVNNLFNGKCSNCKVSVTKLTSLEFNHEDPELKTVLWRDLRWRSYDIIKNYISKEKIKAICRNCHTLINSSTFLTYQHIILDKNIYKYSQKELNSRLDNAIISYIRNNPNLKMYRSYKRDIRNTLKKWLKKRFIIEELYEGRCIGCQEITIDNNLPSLGFHHRIEEKKELIIKWESISNLPLKKIKDLLIEEDCICLCANCHMLIHSKAFIKNADYILNHNDIKILKSEISQIISNIYNFNF